MSNPQSPLFSKTVNTISKYAHKITQQRRKVIAALLICSLGLTLYGTFGTYIAMAATADSTYTVTNTVFFNATVMGYERTFRLDISQDVAINSPDLPIKAIQTTAFEPNITIDLGTQIGVSQRAETPEYFGWGITENTTVLMGAQYADQMELMNTSMYYANFPHTLASYPVTEKQLIFDSPLNYVEAYCDENSLDLVEILNSTYSENVSYSNLNGLHSELVRTCYTISEPVEAPPMAKQLMQYGGSLNPDMKLIQTGLLVLYAIIVAAAAATIIGVTMVISGALTAQHFADANLAAAKYGIDATSKWSTTLKATWDEQQDIAWAAYLAGNLSLQQYQDLCKLYTGQYQPLLANTTTDFQTLLTDYYGAQEDLFAEYANAFGFSTSWSNIFQYLLIFIVVVVAIFVVYSLFFRKKNAGAGAGTTVIKM